MLHSPVPPEGVPAVPGSGIGAVTSQCTSERKICIPVSNNSTRIDIHLSFPLDCAFHCVTAGNQGTDEVIVN